MSVVFRNFLLIILAMLQLVAPLVHAHTGNFKFNEGLHIPGFETYSTIQDAAVIKKVNLDNGAEGLLVVVDTGIKNPLDTSVETKDIEYATPPNAQLLVSLLPSADSNFSPHKHSSSYRIQSSPTSPRAPPA